MSTPAIIGIVDLDQNGAPSGWRAIYCHWGGYPGEVGWLLQTFYDRAAAETLVAGGAVSRLGPDPQTPEGATLRDDSNAPDHPALRQSSRLREPGRHGERRPIGRLPVARLPEGSSGRPTPGAPSGSTCWRRGRTAPTCGCALGPRDRTGVPTSPFCWPTRWREPRPRIGNWPIGRSGLPISTVSG